ncbi:MAG: hypothetical protein B6U69_02115 [Thermofilum sp. ex4484_15]|nr:MAG: hypothetical protein B6U69_02115 [Thermofilum sp. ex4484_15]
MSKSYAYLLALTFIFNLSRSIWINLFPLYLDRIGLNIITISVLSSLTLTLPLLFSGVTGYLADKWGARNSLLIAVVVNSLSLIILARFSSLTVIVTALVSLSVAISLYSQIAISIVAKLNPGRRGEAYGLYYFSNQSSVMLGSFASGAIIALLTYSQLYLIASIVAIAGLPLALRLGVKEGVRREPTPSLIVKIFNSEELRRLMYTVALHDFSAFIPGPFLPLFAKYVIGLNDSQVGFLYGVRGLGTIFFQLIGGKIADKLGPTRALASHIVCVSLSYFLYSLSRDYISALSVMLFQGIIVTLDMPARRSIIAEYAPESYVSSASGLTDMITGLATIPSPVVGGLLWAVNPPLVFITASLLNGVSLLPLKGLKVK